MSNITLSFLKIEIFCFKQSHPSYSILIRGYLIKHIDMLTEPQLHNRCECVCVCVGGGGMVQHQISASSAVPNIIAFRLDNQVIYVEPYLC